ncbi:hypothetical protein XA68_12896 [Ophiocordyceps unilateralis]|uniref:Uncharacterized protein n=1 Tax=Ophiocordyceps unilateralis TaxID=268505 RepID=A0A2A9PDQ6_OPHUN|nr:hypothetical protein XA68_12896 [Ophiocordyceps unilateralis]
MGLPLFVASVESDLSSKSATKGANSSPSRSGIRRLGRPDSRERRASARAAASVRIHGAHPPRPPRSSHDGLLPWVEQPGALDRNASSPRPQPPDSQVTRDDTVQRIVTESSNRELFEDQMAAFFGTDWRERSSRNAGSRDTTERLEARSSQPRRAHLLAPHSSRFDDSRTRSPRAGSPPNDRATGTNMPPGSYSAVAIMTRNSGPRYNARLLRGPRDGRRPPLSRHAPGLDGLGDRNRSLSPEVWDTLLSTLTPDPQPPSAGSSFSSVPSFPPNRLTSAPGTMDEAPADAQCDSGDHSDTSMEEDDENADVRRPQLRESRRRISPFNLSGPTSAEEGASWPWLQDGNRPTTTGEPNRTRGENTDGATARGLPLARLLNGSAEAWASQGSGEEASEEESGSSGRRQTTNNGEGSLSGGATAATRAVRPSGEDDWSGMQRIVSSLARREDIPDEWWAEVGLSRTLRRDFAPNQRPY